VNLHLRGVVLPDGVERDLFVVEGRFSFQPVADAETVLDGGWLVPGLVDTHAHLGMASPAPPGASPEEGARASARAQLAAGVLAVREPGGPNRASTGIGPDQGLPRTFTGGRFLAPPGGYFAGLARQVPAASLAEAAEQEARASGAWAKVIGDFPGPDGRLRANFEPAALAEAAQRVHGVGARIAIHCMGLAEVVEAAIAAGFDSIEHGLSLGPAHLAAMVAGKVAWVPTMTIFTDRDPIRALLASLGMPAGDVAALVAAIDRQPEMVRQAAAAGVLVLAGTDAGMGPHGRIGGEVRLLLDAGLTGEQALGAASWEARRFLGLPVIQDGAPADLVAYPDDPLQDLGVLGRPTLRILDGQLIPA
jgi:imidazolonepropionase-like amidohydrolase